MTTRSYSDLSDSATTFDPEEQFDRDIDERMKGMSREEAGARAMHAASGSEMTYDDIPDWAQLRLRRMFNAALAASTIWDAEHPSNVECALCGGPLPCLTHSQFHKQDKPPHLLDMRGAFKGGGDPPFKAGDVFGNSDGK